MKCEVCGEAMRPGVRSGRYRYAACGLCGHQQIAGPVSAEHVERTYGDAYFYDGGAGYPNYLRQQHVLEQHARQYVERMRKRRSPGWLLDIGSAAGFTTAPFVAAGWSALGLEPNASMAAAARGRGLPTQCGVLEDFQSPQTFDLVLMLQVAAHFVDVRHAFERAADATAAGGQWLIETWNGTSLTARLLKAHWHEYSPPSVLRIFSPQSLDELASQFGMRRVAGGYPAKSIAGDHARSLMAHKHVPAPLIALIPRNACIPYPSEDLMWALYER